MGRGKMRIEKNGQANEKYFHKVSEGFKKCSDGMNNRRLLREAYEGAFLGRELWNEIEKVNGEQSPEREPEWTR